MSSECHKREEIARLLEELDLTLYYWQVFDRWVLELNDSSGSTIWHQRGIGLRELRDELLDYLKTFKSKKRL